MGSLNGSSVLWTDIQSTHFHMQCDTTPSEDKPTAKRRKVRKGTQSCWECKRRKVRCLFAEPTNTVCDNCARRKTTCISQEYIVGSQDATSPKPTSILNARLSRVEDLLERLVPREHPGPVPSRSEALGPRRDTLVRRFHLYKRDLF